MAFSLLPAPASFATNFTTKTPRQGTKQNPDSTFGKVRFRIKSFGATHETRTRDLRVTNALLYRLS